MSHVLICPHLWWDVDPVTGCWLWKRSLDSNGYGKVRVDRKLVIAHRHVYELYRGPIPVGLEIDHVKERCGNRRCVNPDHLEPVVHVENLRRGRGTKLTQDQVDEIRESDEKHVVLSARYGVSKSTISKIRTYTLWG